MQIAWTLYLTDNNDRLVLNYQTPPNDDSTILLLEAINQGGKSWVAGWLDYDPLNTHNTNWALLVNPQFAAFGAYIQTPATYKCPDDSSTVTIAGQQHPRVRSYALPDCLGGEIGFHRLLDVFRPRDQQGSGYVLQSIGPSDEITFLDTHPDTLAYAIFYTIPIPDNWINLPAHYHNNASTMAFTDGHAATHAWTTKTVLAPVTGIQDISEKATTFVDDMKDTDMYWFWNHCYREDNIGN